MQVLDTIRRQPQLQPTVPQGMGSQTPRPSPRVGWECLLAWRPGRRALSQKASGATFVQKLDGSQDSAIHTRYHILLRSSSMREPRYPLPRVVWIKIATLHEAWPAGQTWPRARQYQCSLTPLAPWVLWRPLSNIEKVRGLCRTVVRPHGWRFHGLFC